MLHSEHKHVEPVVARLLLQQAKFEQLRWSWHENQVRCKVDIRPSDSGLQLVVPRSAPVTSLDIKRHHS